MSNDAKTIINLVRDVEKSDSEIEHILDAFLENIIIKAIKSFNDRIVD